MLAAAFCAQAETETVDGITWTYKVSYGKAEIYSGGSSTPAIPSSTKGAITIPSTLGGYPVTSIGDYAFYECSGLTSVTIGNSVTSIGASAFFRCSGLTSVTIGNSVTSIGDYAFCYCSGLTSVTIPDSVTSIGDYAFYYCSGLTSVTIGNSVTSIGDYAFYECSGLTSVTIPNSVTSIGNWAFSYCGSLMSFNVSNDNLYYSSKNGLLLSKDGKEVICGVNGDVTIPDSVTSICGSAFYNCSGLTSETIPNSVTSIGGRAFYGCSGLTSVTIPNSVTSIGRSAFRACSGLTSVTIPDSVTSIGLYAFSGCKPTSVTVPGWECNIDFSNVTNLVISEGTTNIVGSAFYNCSGLTSVTIPDSVTSIGDYVFEECSGLTSVTIPDGVTSIGSSVFSNCDNLSTARVTQCVMDKRFSSVFSSSENSLLCLQIGTDVTAIGEDDFIWGFPSLVKIEVEAGNTSYYVSSTDGCLYSMAGDVLLLCPRNATRITIPNGVTKIGNRAFQYCTNLVSVVIPETVKTIGTSSFANCSKLSGITIPKSVESLPSSAFTGCEALWTDWYRALANLAANGGGSSGGETAAVPDPRYDITACPADRSVATVTVDGDMAIDSFVLSKGKVYDTVLRVINVSGVDATLSLPQGYIYEQFKGAKPLVIPPASTNLLTITRTADKVFFVSREELEIAQ